MDGVTDEELLYIPVSEPPQPTVRDLIIAAVEALKDHPHSSTKTEIEIDACIRLIKALYRGTKFASLQSNRSDRFGHLCNVRNIPSTGQKQDLYNRLLESVSSHLHS
jgi:hypothetical protein